VSDNDGSRIDADRLFQTRGPLTANDRSPNVVLVDGTSSSMWDAEKNLRNEAYFAEYKNAEKSSYSLQSFGRFLLMLLQHIEYSNSVRYSNSIFI